MNKLTIIGNCTSDAQLRTTQNGVSVSSFTVAVNNKYGKNKDDAIFFKVSAWRKLGENCGQHIKRGMKVCVVGPVELQNYTNDKGETKYNMCIQADDVEFLSRVDSDSNSNDTGNNTSDSNNQPTQSSHPIPDGYSAVPEDMDLPF